MSKTKSSDNPRYETLYIVSNKFSEDEVKPIFEKVNRLVTENDGKITKQENWGKKRLSYPIKGFGYGYYGLLEFELPAISAGKLDRSLKLMPEIIRHQTIKLEGEWTRPTREFKDEKPKVKPEKPEKQEKAMSQEDLKDLDEKLDKILETNDLL